jgi:Flp pilus assembly pilin Flp
MLLEFSPMLVSVMKAKTCLRNFARNESGAVTVDWVALTAGIIVVGLAIVWYIMDNGVDVLAGKIVTGLAAIDPTTTTGAPRSSTARPPAAETSRGARSSPGAPRACSAASASIAVSPEPRSSCLRPEPRTCALVPCSRS